VYAKRAGINPASSGRRHGKVEYVLWRDVSACVVADAVFGSASGCIIDTIPRGCAVLGLSGLHAQKSGALWKPHHPFITNNTTNCGQAQLPVAKGQHGQVSSTEDTFYRDLRIARLGILF
jgi:hypothetical protein